ncbi:MAG TPA: hypothetical protein VD931_15665 [Baekduia sp.]|nr:hypothetical protein [Baekduia sp.]
MSRDPLDHGWWLVSRATGIVALLAISATVGLGLLLASREHRRPGLAAAATGLHEHLALVGLLGAAVHAVTLLGDPFLRPGLSGILVPFAIGYRPAWVAAGIAALVLGALLGLTFYARRRIGPRRWRSAHRAVVVVWVLAVGHALGAGTDAQTPWLRAVLLASAAPVLYAGVLRLARALDGRRPAAGRA